MTTLMELALDRMKGLAPDTQDEVARMVLSFVGQDDEVFELTPDDVEAVRLSREAAARGDIATDDEVCALREKHGL